MPPGLSTKIVICYWRTCVTQRSAGTRYPPPRDIATTALIATVVVTLLSVIGVGVTIWIAIRERGSDEKRKIRRHPERARTE